MGHKHSKPGQKQKVVFSKKKIKKVRLSLGTLTRRIAPFSLSVF